jgi:acyl-CoA synthetase (AMP-forming)/AMP-acid ligase II
VKKRILLCSVLVFVFLVAAGIAWFGSCPSLPTSQLTPTVSYPGPNSTFIINFSEIPAAEVSDVLNGVDYPGWCLEDGPPAPLGIPLTLFCSVSPGLPSEIASHPWNMVNYILNHKIGTWREVQAALWILGQGNSETFPETANAWAMYNDAIANGGSYIPMAGEIVAVIMYTADGGFGPDSRYQETILEILIPPYTGEGCTPGYWKNHLEAWPAGYTPAMSFNTVFGVNYFDPSFTLGQAIRLGGGGINVIARHGTAALLSAAHPGVGYYYTVDQVKAMVKAGGVNIELLIDENERGCPLGNGK